MKEQLQALKEIREQLTDLTKQVDIIIQALSPDQSLSKEAKTAKNDYMRKYMKNYMKGYRKRNPEKVKQSRERYWMKKYTENREA